MINLGKLQCGGMQSCLHAAVKFGCQHLLIEPDLLAQLALHRLDLVIADEPLTRRISVKAYNHALGTSPMSFFCAPALRSADTVARLRASRPPVSAVEATALRETCPGLDGVDREPDFAQALVTDAIAYQAALMR